MIQIENICDLLRLEPRHHQATQRGLVCDEVPVGGDSGGRARQIGQAAFEGAGSLHFEWGKIEDEGGIDRELTGDGQYLTYPALCRAGPSSARSVIPGSTPSTGRASRQDPRDPTIPD